MWPAFAHPYFITPKGKRIDFEVDQDVRYLYPGTTVAVEHGYNVDLIDCLVDAARIAVTAAWQCGVQHPATV